LVAARLHELQRQLPDLTGGEGTLESAFDGYQAVRGRPPVRHGWIGSELVTAGTR
jgi:ribosomal protection tetracycline resistance protein